MKLDSVVLKGLLLLSLFCSATGRASAAEATDIYSFVKPLDLVKLELQDTAASALFTVPDMPGFKYVVMPMRI